MPNKADHRRKPYRSHDVASRRPVTAHIRWPHLAWKVLCKITLDRCMRVLSKTIRPDQTDKNDVDPPPLVDHDRLEYFRRRHFSSAVPAGSLVHTDSPGAGPQ